MFFKGSSECKMQGKKHRYENNASSPAAEDHSVVPPSREKICDGCFGKWSCCGKNCYYFSKDVKTWKESKKSCEGRASTLIKIDDEEEQDGSL
ncbi:NKG2-D type II integral membrane protein-like [Talpa occidentalis]|uniref:NKG2-D type II integral membrane protein-like n=1 Tax=Talpa occidentalis TaxID=50954 RepID=UPI00188EFB8B|nr:NKG2-D type II integral membrane protein-like [Talpa occidentalis]